MSNYVLISTLVLCSCNNNSGLNKKEQDKVRGYLCIILPRVQSFMLRYGVNRRGYFRVEGRSTDGLPFRVS